MDKPVNYEEWYPNPGPQTEVLQRDEDEILFGGARGGGKTDAGIVWMVAPEYITNPRYAGLVIRKNADDLTSWIERARYMYACLGAEFSGKPPIIRFPSGAYIKLGHLKDDQAYTKYQGHEYQKVNVEELTQIPYEENYLKLISSCRSTIPGLKPMVFASANPGGVGHVWVKKRYVDVALNKTFYYEAEVMGRTVRRSRIFIPSRVEDCPQIIENDPGYVVYLESLPEELREAWRYGNWDIFTGQFFDMWNPSVHVIPQRSVLQHGWGLYRGLDWGYTAPAAVVWIAVDFSGNHYIYREFYESGNTPTQFAQKVLRMTGEGENIITTYADPSIWAKSQYGVGKYNEQATTRSIYDTLAEAGLYCTKANNDRINGWNKMRDLLYWDANKKPKLYVCENCPNVIRTLPMLMHDEKHVEDVDTDGEDHLGDGIRYPVMHTYDAHKPPREKGRIEQLIDRITVPAEESRPWDAEL